MDYRAIIVRNLVNLFNLLVVPVAVALFLLNDNRGAVAVSGVAVVKAFIGIMSALPSRSWSIVPLDRASRRWGRTRYRLGISFLIPEPMPRKTLLDDL